MSRRYTAAEERESLLAADPKHLTPALRAERDGLVRAQAAETSAAGRAPKLLAKLDTATVNAELEPDCRRVLSAEASSVRAALQRGDLVHAGRAVIEAERVMRMWLPEAEA